IKDAASSAGKQALVVLDDKDVIDRASPPLRVLLKLRKAPCMKKVLLFEKVKREGDKRSVDFLESLRSAGCNRREGDCCSPGKILADDTIRGLNAKLEKESP